jgi:hypothetical protein
VIRPYSLGQELGFEPAASASNLSLESHRR